MKRKEQGNMRKGRQIDITLILNFQMYKYKTTIELGQISVVHKASAYNRRY